MKFCHIEESGGQQVMFRVTYWYAKCWCVYTEVYHNDKIMAKQLFKGSKQGAFEHFQTLDFKNEAYNFLTEVASCG